MLRVTATFLLALALACVDGAARPNGSSAAQGGRRFAVARGSPELYRAHCLVCHGENGRGNGPAAEFLMPRPRDFTTGAFRLRSTPTGQLPTDDDLERVITHGIPGSSMPSFAFLQPRERRALVQYVKSLTVMDVDGQLVNRFELFPPERTMDPGQPPPRTEQLLARGRELYRAVGCNNCHGETGRGDGPSAPTLKDSEGFPIRATNFAQGVFKGGSDPRDIYLRLVTGMTGTPMPSQEGALPEERDRWAVVYHVLSLVRSERPLEYQSHTTISARRVQAVGRADPDAPYWVQAPSTWLALMSTWERMEAPRWLEVRAVHDGQNFALRLEWEDWTADGIVVRTEDFSDAASVQFGLSDDPGLFTMGDPDHAVNIWAWRMDWQMDLARFEDVETRYPNMMVESYPSERGARVTDPDYFPGHVPITPGPSHDPLFLSGTAAGNPFSDTRRPVAAMNMTARGFGTIEALAPERQVVEARGRWVSGRWQVVFVRSSSALAGEVRLESGRRVPVAFAVWDGSASDRDGQKHVTYWQQLVLER